MILSMLAGQAGCVAGDDAPADLKVAGTSPENGGTWPARRALEVRFDRYLSTFMEPASMSLTSGEVGVPLAPLYDPVSRALLVQPVDELVPGLGYTLIVQPGAVWGLDGQTLDEPVRLDFVATAAVPDPPAPEVDFERDLAPLFAGRCSCHGPPRNQYPELTPEALVEQPSQRQPGAILVRPGLPLRSMLVRKVLPGYPGVPGEQMPPGETLPAAELRRLIDWIGSL